MKRTSFCPPKRKESASRPHNEDMKSRQPAAATGHSWKTASLRAFPSIGLHVNRRQPAACPMRCRREKARGITQPSAPSFLGKINLQQTKNRPQQAVTPFFRRRGKAFRTTKVRTGKTKVGTEKTEVRTEKTNPAPVSAVKPQKSGKPNVSIAPPACC